MKNWIENIIIFVVSFVFGILSVMDLGVMLFIILIYINMKLPKKEQRSGY